MRHLLAMIVVLSACGRAPIPVSAPQAPRLDEGTKVARPVGMDVDSDGDGLTDYAEMHKYFTDPHKRDTAGDGVSDGDWDRRRAFTYTISAVLKIAKPADIAAMNDDYQDARIVAEDADALTVEVVYYPLNDNQEAIAEDPDWKHDDAAMTADLAPSATVNWDPAMREELLVDLAADGIYPDRLTDKQLVERVSHWALRRARTTPAFSLWFVDFTGGTPRVAPSLRAAFDKQKPRPDVTDADMFADELFGKDMYRRKVHGTCTSSATYLATILRALGIPTRIVVMVPPADPNDGAQVDAFVRSIRLDAKTRAAVTSAYEHMRGSFSDHLFNEVFVGGRWVRLNYDVLGQNIVDAHYLGLMTHVGTYRDVSEMDIPRTWGRRYGLGENDAPTLSSSNPYMLIKAQGEHVGRFAHVDEPAAVPEAAVASAAPAELQTVTIVAVVPPDAPTVPAFVRGKPPSDVLICIAEWLPGQDYHQMRAFEGRVGHTFVLKLAGHPGVHLELDGGKFSAGDGTFQAFGARVVAEDRTKVVPGATYTLEPQDTSTTYRWTVNPGLVVRLHK
jgi:hypothetical protein